MQNESHVSYNNFFNENLSKQKAQGSQKANVPTISQPFVVTNYSEASLSIPAGLPSQISPLEQQQLTTTDNENTFMKNLSPERQFIYFRRLVCVWITWHIAVICFSSLFLSSQSLKELTSSEEEWQLYPPFYYLLFATIILLIVGANSKKLRNPPYATLVLFGVIFCQSSVFASFAASFRCKTIFGKEQLKNDDDNALEFLLFFEVCSLLSLGLLQFSTFFALNLDIKKYVKKATVFAIVLVVIDLVFSLSLDELQLIFLMIIFPFYGFLIMNSGKQIMKGKFQLRESQTSAGAMALYINLFIPFCGNN